jgi:hypothetical protein
MKTYAEWQEGNHGDLGEYLQVGDEVGEDMYWYFLEVLPPITWTLDEVQLGEPIDSDSEGHSRFSTLQRKGERWFYAGVLTTPRHRIQPGQGEEGVQ